MAEVAQVPATVAAEQVAAATALKPAGRGRGRGKFKGRGKAKKGKGKKVVAVVDPNAPPKPKKEPKLSLKAQVEKDIGDRNIEDVIKEARATIEALQAAVQKAQDEEMAYETKIMEGKMQMEQASAEVDASVHKETIALEKFKAAKQALVESQKKTIEKKLALGEEEKAMDVLQNEGEKNKKEADLLREKQEAQAAKEAAKKAYIEAQAEAKRVAEEMKAKRQTLAITDDPEAEAKAKERAEKEEQEAQAKREAKSLQKDAARDLKQQLSELERQRKARDKERAQWFKQAAGLGPKKRMAALGDGVAASPAKAGRIQDVD